MKRFRLAIAAPHEKKLFEQRNGDGRIVSCIRRARFQH